MIYLAFHPSNTLLNSVDCWTDEKNGLNKPRSKHKEHTDRARKKESKNTDRGKRNLTEALPFMGFQWGFYYFLLKDPAC